MNRWSGRKDQYSACVKTSVEQRIVEITFGSPMLGFASADKRAAPEQRQLHEQVVIWITKWRLLLANRTNLSVSDEHLRLEADFLVTSFPLLTLGDLNWAQDCYISRTLPIDYPDIFAFNADFLSRVLHGYRRFKRALAERLQREVERQRLLNKTATPAENADAMRYMLTEVDRQLREDVPYVFMLREVRDYLVKTGQLKDAEVTAETKAYISRRQNTLAKHVVKSRDAVPLKDILQGGSPLTAGEAKRVQETLLIEWSVKTFFANHPVETVVAAVKEDYWKKNKKEADEVQGSGRK